MLSLKAKTSFGNHIIITLSVISSLKYIVSYVFRSDANGYHGDHLPFGIALGHAFYPGYNDNLQGDVHINNKGPWAEPPGPGG